MPTIVNFRDVILQGQAPRVLSLAPAAFTATFVYNGVQLSVIKSSNPAVINYEYRVGATWAGAAVLTQNGGTNYTWPAQAAGTYTLWVAAVDNVGSYSTPISVSVTVTPATITTFTDVVSSRNLQLNWTAAQGSYSTLSFEVRSGASGVTWAAATSLGFYNVNTYQEQVVWTGAKDYLVAASDVAGNVSTPSRLAVVVSAPGAPTAPYVNVVDNDVLIYWTAPAVSYTQLPIASYETRKGATWATSTLIGSNGNATFAGVFEQTSGVFTYWIAAIDTTGTYGLPVQVTATVNQPPDFIFRNNFNSALGGTLVNAYMEVGSILLPADVTQTFASHFTNNGWTTPAAQATAGYPVYANPSLTSASYTEVIDYGVTTPSSIVTSTLGYVTVTGTVTPTCQISYKLLSTDAWTVLSVGSIALIPANFRYVQIAYSFACTAGANLIRLNTLNVKLSIKLRNDSGSAPVNNTNVTIPATGSTVYPAGTTPVSLAYPFIYADTPMVVVNGLDSFSKPYFAAVIYTGIPNPRFFAVQIFNSAGTLMTSSAITFSWTARGY